MITMHVFGKDYDILGENLKCVEMYGLNHTTLRTRLTKGWTLHEACQVPKSGRLEDFRTKRKLEAINYDTEKGRKRYKEEKRKSYRPWLYDGTPQQHRLGNYTKLHMENNIFPKIKSDYYRNTQLV